MKTAGVPGFWTSVRLSFRLSTLPRPGLALLPLGIALGPHGLAVITEPVLATLDPAISLALATIGALIGFELRWRGSRGGSPSLVGGLQSLTTMVVVGVGLFFLRTYMPDAPALSWVAAAWLGAAAGASSAIVVPSAPASLLRLRIGDFHDALPILTGGAVWMWAATPSGSTAPLALAVAEPVVLGGLLALAGWLLSSAATSEAEQRAFTIGTLLLLGGAAATVSTSALFSGLIAGVAWGAARGAVRDHLERDVRYLQQPLMVLLLVLAGARLEPSMGVLSLATAFTALRIIGKLVGGWLASTTARDSVPRDLGVYLVAPGIAGLALAVDIAHSGVAADAAVVLGVVLLGGIGSELVAIAARPAESPS